MTRQVQRLRIEEIDWQSVLPALRIFESFRMAIHPPKLLVSLLLVVLLYVGGAVLDLMWGAPVHRGEIERYATLDGPDFDQWRLAQDVQTREDLRRLLVRVPGLSTPASTILDSPNPFATATDAINAAFAGEYDRARIQAVGLEAERLTAMLRGVQTEHRAYLEDVQNLRPRGVFETALEAELSAFDQYVAAATSLRLGVGDLLAGTRSSDTIIGALRQMVMTIPGWLLQTHPWFSLISAIGALGAVSLLGGTVARMAALHATRGDSGPVHEAVRFAATRWSGFFFAPLLPPIVMLVLGGVLTLTGLLLFNLPVTDIVGGMLFGLSLLVGMLMAVTLLGLAGGLQLLFPAVAVDGSDAFDANSRSLGYLRGAPWRWLTYNLTLLVYGATTYLFLGVIVFLTIRFTQFWVSLAVFRETSHGVNRFEAILAPPRLGQLAYHINWAALDVSGKVAATLVSVWVYLVIGLLGAYAISFVICGQTWVYLLLRRAVEGTEFDEVVEIPVPEATEQAASRALPDKFEPGQAQTTRDGQPEAGA
jgi:hypothetical protein